MGAILLAVLARDHLGLVGQGPFWGLCGIAIGWEAFVIWRWWRYVKEAAYKAGKNYEKSDRYQLPPEYADSEDALMAAKRTKKRVTPPPH